MTDDFFRNRLGQMIDFRYPQAVLAARMPWQEIHACLAQGWAPQLKLDKKSEDMEERLARAMEVALALKLIAKKALSRAIVDPGVLKARAHTLNKARHLVTQTDSPKAVCNRAKRCSRHVHEVVYADLGYRGVDKDNPEPEIQHQGKDKRWTNGARKRLKRYPAIEPIIGHLRAEHCMGRRHLEVSEGDALHAVLCAAGHFHSLLDADDRQKGLGPLVVLCASERFGGNV
jgi:hypothetical protein